MAELVIALDIEKDRAKGLITLLSSQIDIYKIGHPLFISAGDEIVNLLTQKNKKIIFDFKYHDIPNTVALAISSITKKYQPFGLTLHTSGGKTMLNSAVEVINKLPVSDRPILFGVTVLTSLNENDLSSLGITRTPKEQVIKLAELAKDCGLKGIVCSGQEIESVKNVCVKNFLTLVPGLSIESTENKQFDQKRTMTVAEAIEKGADYIVLGRAVYDAAEPEKVVEKIYQIINDE